MRFRALVALLAVPTLALGAPKKKGTPAVRAGDAPPTTKTPSPCGDKILPLAVGNSWTYAMVPAPLPPDDQIKRISPAEVDSITITVKSIDAAPKGGDTTITLEEKTSTDLTPRQGQIRSTSPCSTSTRTRRRSLATRRSSRSSPESFFFAGEPGGYIGHQARFSSSARRARAGSSRTAASATSSGARTSIWPGRARRPRAREAKLGSGKHRARAPVHAGAARGVTTKLGVYTAEKLGLADDRPRDAPTARHPTPSRWSCRRTGCRRCGSRRARRRADAEPVRAHVPADAEPR